MNEDDDDARLVAFIDGELDESERRAIEARLAAEPILKERLASLLGGQRPFAPAFEVLLDEAPIERLKTSLAGLVANEQRPTRQAPSFRLSRLGIAAALALFCVGVALGRYGPAWISPIQEAASPSNELDEDWRHAVAEYMTLYTPDTFAAMPPPPQVALAAIGAKIGVNLEPDRIALANLQLKGAQILNYEGAPLGELAYLDAATGPVLFCIIKTAEPDAAISSGKRMGFAVASWAQAGHGYMLIGRLPDIQLAELADLLRRRF